MVKKKTHEQYYQECKFKGLDLPIENYINNKTKIKHRCSKGHVYEQAPSIHLQGHGCPVCYGNKKKFSNDYYKECKKKGLDLPIENYINNYTKIKHKCSKCGNIYEQKPSNHLYGHSCPICSKKRPYLAYTQGEYTKLAATITNAYPIEKYKGRMTKIKHKCNNCGNIYEQTPNDLLRGHFGCPYCTLQSHGEKYIRNYLNSNSIKYTPQKKFHDLKDKTYLSYDFYLPDYNILIEYQGKQHYESIDYFGGENTFKKQQEHDNIKREYAKENGYKLLELKYTLNTQELVDKYLSRRIK